MTKTFEAVIDYLEKCGLVKTARVMRKELAYNNGIVLDSDKENHLKSKNIRVYLFRTYS
jgi:hypothetical protein